MKTSSVSHIPVPTELSQTTSGHYNDTLHVVESRQQDEKEQATLRNDSVACSSPKLRNSQNKDETIVKTSSNGGTKPRGVEVLDHGKDDVASIQRRGGRGGRRGRSSGYRGRRGRGGFRGSSQSGQAA
jgi:hypothetical protein